MTSLGSSGSVGSSGNIRIATTGYSTGAATLKGLPRQYCKPRLLRLGGVLLLKQGVITNDDTQAHTST